MVKIVWGEDHVFIYLYAWHVLKAWHLYSMEKIKDNGVWCVILNNLHTIMYMPIELGENIEAFMTHGGKKSLKTSPNICWWFMDLILLNLLFLSWYVN
jgi:hypothetical protein